ncbi:hypothetical protein FRC01_007328, partial [Tulasnella sp. 417]
MTYNVLLVGYGAVGVVVAYALQRTGKVNVTAVARSNYNTVCEGKLNLKSQQYGEVQGLKPFRVVRTVAEAIDQPYDYVVITTKAIPELYPTPKIVAPLLSSDYKHPQPTYVLMQNGLGVERELHAALQEKELTRSAKIITGAIQIMTNMVGDAVIHGDFTRFFGGIYQGEDELPSVSSSYNEALYRLVELLKEGGVEAKIDLHAQAAKFRKNIWNASLAMLSCLTRTPCDVFFRDQVACQSSVKVLLTIAAELDAIARALDYPDEYLWEPTVFVEHYRKHHLEDTSGHKASTLLDLEAGRPFELEVILGEV